MPGSPILFAPKAGTQIHKDSSLLYDDDDSLAGLKSHVVYAYQAKKKLNCFKAALQAGADRFFVGWWRGKFQAKWEHF